MKVAAIQMQSTEDVKGNVAKAVGYIERAAKEGASLAVLPEFFNTIFFAQYWDKKYFKLAEPEDGFTLSEVRKAAQQHGIAVVAAFYEIDAPGLYFDTAFHIASDGAILHKYRKVHPAGVLSLEKIYFRYGSSFDTYSFNDWRLGIGICYDMAFPETARSLAQNGAELLIAPYATSRKTMFQEVLRTRAFENGCYLVAANKVDREGDWTLSGGSFICDPEGAVLATAETSGEALLLADIDLNIVTQARIDFPTRRDRRPELYGALTRPAIV